MEKYSELLKSLLLTITSASILIFMYRKRIFKSYGKDFYQKSLDYRLIGILITGIVCGIILAVKAYKKL